MNYVLIVKMSMIREYDFVLKTLKELEEEIKIEDGCLYFDILVEEQMKDVVIYEVWETKKHWERHSSSPHMKKFTSLIENQYFKLSVEDYTKIV